MTLYSYWDIYTPEKIQAAKNFWIVLLCILLLVAVICLVVGTIFNRRKAISIICIAVLLIGGGALNVFTVEEEDGFRFMPKQEWRWESYREGKYSETTGSLQILEVSEKNSQKNPQYRVCFRAGSIYFLQGTDLSAAQLDLLRQYDGTPVRVRYSARPENDTVYSIESVSAELPAEDPAPEGAEETVYDYFAHYASDSGTFRFTNVFQILLECVPFIMLVLLVLKACFSDTKAERIGRFICLVGVLFCSFTVAFFWGDLNGLLGQTAREKRNWEQFSSGIYSECTGSFHLTDAEIYDEEDEESCVFAAFDVDGVRFPGGINTTFGDFKKLSSLEGKAVRVRFSAEDGAGFIYTLEALPESE